MAASRAPRCNAGNRMSRVLEGELDEDDFYTTTYGGFNEEDEDGDFEHEMEDSADEVDSDFDRSEDDEIKSEEEDVDKPKPRKKGIITKAYKEPATRKQTKAASGTSIPNSSTQSSADSKSKKRNLESSFDGPMRKSSRKSTATNSLMTIMRQKEREESDKKKKEVGKKPVTGVRRLTQEELLKLAEKTEKKNLKSLEKYQRLEANRKKVTVKRKTFDGPTVTFLSTVVPVEDSTPDKNTASPDEPNTYDPNKMSRNFVVFSDDATFDKTFYHKRKRTPSKLYCPVTRKPARYIDPLTKIPYYDMTAYKIIRQLYQDTVKELKSTK